MAASNVWNFWHRHPSQEKEAVPMAPTVEELRAQLAEAEAAEAAAAPAPTLETLDERVTALEQWKREPDADADPQWTPPAPEPPVAEAAPEVAPPPA